MRRLLDTTAFRNGTLHLSYGAFNYPYFYQRTTGLMTPIGFLPEVWKMFTKHLEYHQYPYEDSSSIVCDGVLLPVQEGRTLTTAGAYTPTQGRMEMFRQSTVTYYTAFNFYEAERETDQQTTDLYFFTVFSIPALFLIILSFVVASLLQFFIESLRDSNDKAGVQRHVLVDASMFIARIVYTLGVMLTVYYHSAGFRGNSVLFANTVQTSFADLVSGLHDGSRLLMTKSATTIRSDTLFALVGNRTTQSDVAEPDQTMFIQRLCDDHRLVAMMEVNAVYSMPMVSRPCLLKKVTIPQPWKYLERYDIQFPQMYLMSRNYTKRKTTETVNQVLLRMFRQEMIESFWTNRFMKAVKNKPSIKPEMENPDEIALPMSLTRLQLLFYFTGPGWFLSIVVFCMELSHRITAPFMRCLHYRTIFNA